MLQILSIDLFKLKPEEKELFRPLCYREGEIYLDYPEKMGGFDTFGVFWDGQPIGIAIMSREGLLKTATIEDFYIAEPWRNRGVGTQLMQHLIEFLKKKEYVVLIIKYESRSDTLEGMEKILDREHFHPPEILNQRYHFSSFGFNPPWLYRNYPLSSGLEIFPWDQLTPDEEERIRFKVDHWAIPEEISPFDDPPIPVEYSCSFGLRNQKEVIGWAVLHRVAQDTLRYTALYLKDEHRNGRAGVALLTRAMFAHKASIIPNAYFEINQKQVKKGWMRFVEDKLQPYAHAYSELLTRWKNLKVNDL